MLSTFAFASVDKFVEPTAAPRDRCDQESRGSPNGSDERVAAASDAGKRISRRRVDGVLCHGTCRVLSPSRPLAIGLLCLGKLDDQLLRLDLDARNVGVDEAAVVNRLRQFEMLPNRSDDQRLDLGCRHPAYRSGALGLALEQGGRQIVSVLDAAPCGHGSGVMRLPRSSKMRPASKASDFILAAL